MSTNNRYSLMYPSISPLRLPFAELLEGISGLWLAIEAVGREKIALLRQKTTPIGPEHTALAPSPSNLHPTAVSVPTHIPSIDFVVGGL